MQRPPKDGIRKRCETMTTLQEGARSSDGKQFLRPDDKEKCKSLSPGPQTRSSKDTARHGNIFYLKTK
jgi:hypothetical protein